MNVHITGRHLTVTQAMQDYAREKASKLDRFFDRIQHVDVVMDVDGLQHLVEMTATLVRHVKVFGKAQAADMYAAIDLAESKLKSQIHKFHDRLKAHRDRTRIGKGTAPTPAQEEETYDQVVREMLEEEEK
ncbi:MAG: ribosome hibernation-promoting factor, HPF/YfiA family [Planctomycetota bacterium]